MGWIEKRENGIFRYCWRENGKVRKKTLKTNKRSVAVSRKKIFDAKYEINGTLIIKKTKKNIESLFEDYFEFKKNLIAAKSLLNYKASVKNSISFFNRNGIYDIDKLDSNTINKYINHRIENNTSSKTLSDELMLLRSLIRFEIQNENLDKDPVKIWPKLKKKVKKPETIGIYSNHEIREMREYIKEKQFEFYDLFVFLIYTGCRLNEALEFRKMNIDLEKNRVSIRNFKTETNPENAYRHIEIHSELRTVLERRLHNKENNNDIIFDEAIGKSKNWANREITKTCKKLSIPYKRLHGLRHTWITNLLNAGVPVPQVQHLAGHRKIDTTMRYYKYVNAEVRGKINLIEY